MPFEKFITRFRELGWKETRTATTMNGSDLPDDSYAFIEMYCNEQGCDCRRVIFEVVSEKRKKPVAYVSFGWENAAFYAHWLGQDDPETVKQLQGPILHPDSPQSKFAPAVLELTKSVLQDEKFVERLKRHYKMFREANRSQSLPTRHLDDAGTPEVEKTNLPDKVKSSKIRKRHRPRRTGN